MQCRTGETRLRANSNLGNNFNMLQLFKPVSQK